VDGAARDWLVDVEVAVADLEVKAAVGIRADPGLEVDGRPLAAEVGERDKVAGLAFLTLWKAGKVHFRSPPHFFVFVSSSVQNVASIAEFT